jgi:hypothetical protein
VEQADVIAAAEREARRGRPGDAVPLLCAVLVAQLEEIEALKIKVGLLQAEQANHREPW